jgi:hypothetical protein
MGWWKVQGTEIMIGDLPLDALDDAANTVVREYQAAWGRRPTKQEWESLLRAVLGSATSEERVTDEGVVKEVNITLHGPRERS